MPSYLKKIKNLATFYTEDSSTDDLVDEYSSFVQIYREMFDKPGKNQLQTDQVLPFTSSNDMYRALPNLCILY